MDDRRTLTEHYHRNRLLIWVMGVCFLYALAFIARTSFRIGGERYFSLFDDAMVSMRYGRNLAQGYGLVWNPGGERVEGYTNPLWVLYMAGVHLLPFAAPKISLVIQLTGAGLLLVNLVFVAKITERLSPGSTLAPATAVLLTGFYSPLNNWALQGMEVGLVCVVVAAGVWLALRCLESERVPYLLYLVLGLGTAVRPDMVVPFVTIVVYLLIVDRTHRLRHVALGVMTLGVFVGGQTAFRWFYYHDVLPNTYYLKMTGYPTLSRILHGAQVFARFAERFMLGLLLLLPGLVFFKSNRRAALLMSLIAMQALYGMYVGGDAWESAGGSNRYLSIVVPLIFVLIGCGVEEGYRFWRRYVRARAKTISWAPHVRSVVQVLVSLTVVTLNFAAGKEVGRRWLLLTKPLGTKEIVDKVQTGLLLRDVTAENATVAVVWAGAEPYFMGRRAVDLLGRSDRHIAHEAMRSSTRRWYNVAPVAKFWPGHLKYDYAYSIGVLKPDVVAELWHDPDEAEPYLQAAYRRVQLYGEETNHTVYVREGSPRILWHRVNQVSSAVTRP